jgi:sugar phosphate isomerase/epimerase
VHDAVRLLHDADCDDVPILVDPLHLVRSGGSIADVRTLPPQRLPYAQMSDGLLAPGEPDLALAKRIGLGTRRMPGDGVLPLADIVAALPSGIPLSIEVIMERPPDISGTQWARTALERTRTLLASASSRRAANTHARH